MGSDLTQRIAAALDEAEKTARAATPGPWYTDSGFDFGHRYWIIANVLREKYGNNALSFGEDEGTARYVAAWSPDRVLALIAADRDLLGYATELAASGEPNAVAIADGLVKYLAARWVTS
jgi:hypothetical protein